MHPWGKTLGLLYSVCVCVWVGGRSKAVARIFQGRARQYYFHTGAEGILLPTLLLLLRRNTIWRRFFWWGNSPTITTASTTVLQPAHLFTAVKTAGTNTTHSDFSGKSQVSFSCLSSTTQLGFLCNLISNKPIFWAARTQTEMEISQIYSLASSRQDGGNLPSGRQGP